MNLKQKKEIINKVLCLGNIVQYDDESIQLKTNFTGNIMHFSLEHGKVNESERQGVHKYLMENYHV